jgi:P27 family predicted phage terminase small subunit
VIDVPRTKKPAGTTVDRRNGHRADLVAVAGARFDPPEGLSDEANAAWDAYWDDTVATVMTPVDRAVLIRWIREMDRYLRLTAEADGCPSVRGSQGQPVENPLYATAYKALGVVQACEKQMGMGALNRSALGIAVITEQKSLADMNAKYGGGDGRSGEPRAVEDPRIRVIEGEASG